MLFEFVVSPPSRKEIRFSNLECAYMEGTPDIEELKQRVSVLQSEITSKQETNTAISELRESVKLIEQKLVLTDRLLKIEQEQDNWRRLAKCVSVTVAIVALGAGIFGVYSVHKFFEDQGKYLKEQADKRLAFAADLSYGLALADKQPTFAIPYLLRCFLERPFDEPIVIALLSAADNADDWATLRTATEELRKHPAKVASFTDALTFNNIGLAELDLVFEDPSHMARAKEFFEKGIQIAPADRQDVLWYLHSNFWRYYLMADDLQRAQQEAESARRFDPPSNTDDWAKASQWLWFRTFFKAEHKINRSQIEQMYKQLSRAT
jgi:hypothetical protein